MLKTEASRAVVARVVALLKAARVRQNLSMTQLAAAAGLSQQMVSYVERGMRNPTLDTLLRLSQALSVDLWKILKTTSESGRRR